MDQNEKIKEWYKEHETHHAHCPLGCEHPQPIIEDDGTALCGRCLFVDKVRTEVVSCMEEIC